ncbi:histidine--tRNA ligase [Candidatus Altiarchaeales archaeon WOR_SM1_SCG]|nr:histidine--tRNA ligase [Candidatus Altiarchaeales archaeon WOR_SM1_SCG]
MKIKRPRGTRDFSPEEMRKRNFVKNRIEEIYKKFNYSEITIPTYEHLELFNLKSGDDIRDAMYVFRDKKGRELCLRPEATASVCRFFANELRNVQKPLKFYYYCPMFRYERPQKGRYREFFQSGIELIGPKNPGSDAEAITVAYRALKNLNLNFELEIGHLGILRGLLNDLGIAEEKQDELINAVDKKDIKVLENIVEHQIIFNILELKGDSKIIKKAENLLKDYPAAVLALCELKEILLLLDILGVGYVIDLGVARGLEYYTGMVFEIRVPELGAQCQIAGGGRYDKLIELFNGPKTPAVGFAYGFDRVIDAYELQGLEIPGTEVDFVITAVDYSVQKNALKIASKLRENFVVDFDLMNRKLGKVLDYADGLNAKFVIIVGPREFKENKVSVRNMKTKERKIVGIDELGNLI